MAANKKLLVLPGDGIGPEVMGQVERVIDWFGDKRAVGFDVERGLVGGAAYDAHGTPLTDETLADGTRRAVDTQVYTEAEIRRVAAVGFELARERNNKVHSVEKANVMETGVLWRQVVTELHQESYSDIELEHMYADNCAMQLVRTPKQFDVIVTDNLFGDILSDCAAMLTGSLGMLPSASLGAPDETGRRRALYEPVHGSAPDIAGQGAANPLACLLSYSMMLRYSFGLGEDADLVDQAVANVLRGGVRTADIMGPGTAKVSTSVMGDSILHELENLAG